MDLKSEFSKGREKALSTIKTEENIEAARKFLEELVVMNLRNQQRWNPTSTYYCITFYAVSRAGGSFVSYNTDVKIECKIGDPAMEVSPKVLSVAVSEASEMYNIHASEFVSEEGIMGYRFEISI